MLFGACTLTTKLSVLFFYSRVFTSRSMRIATKVTLVLVVLWGIGNLLQTFLVCHIIDGVWYVLLGLAFTSFVQYPAGVRHSILQVQGPRLRAREPKSPPPPNLPQEKHVLTKHFLLNACSKDKFSLTTQQACYQSQFLP